ncbi:MAG TPA: ABC transporter permease [Vicinamibacteria bacterium]|nr:ABC transporter permease [Vicinamibacteria bacterium]
MERIRSKAFLISTVLGPLLVIGVTVVPGLLMQRQRGRPLRVAVADATGQLRPALEDALRRQKAVGQARFEVRPGPAEADEAARQSLRVEVMAGRLDGYVYVPADAIATSKAEYHGRNVTNVFDIGLVDRAVEETIVGHRLAGAGIRPDDVKALTRPVDLRTVRLTTAGAREDRGATMVVAMVLLMMLYSTVAMWGAAIMNGVIEEKSNRVVEVIVSSIPTSSLFAGKLLGVGLAGLTQFTFWVACMMAVGAYGSAMSPGARWPEMPPGVAAAFVLYFLLGFFLYGALYAAVGSTVNTQQEAQSLAFPVMMPLILGVVFFPAVLSNPEGPLAVTLSMIPFLAPLLMFLRITVLTPPAWQIAGSIALLLATIAGLTWAAARVYRVGILMYGKRPTFPEIVRWARLS